MLARLPFVKKHKKNNPNKTINDETNARVAVCIDPELSLHIEFLFF